MVGCDVVLDPHTTRPPAHVSTQQRAALLSSLICRITKQVYGGRYQKYPPLLGKSICRPRGGVTKTIAHQNDYSNKLKACNLGDFYP
jgi:hypothetical protein